jgi:hypothetical protein
MAARLHADGCRSRAVGWGRECDCLPGRFEERSEVNRPGPGVILSIFRRTTGEIVFAVESTRPESTGRIALLSAEELG